MSTENLGLKTVTTNILQPDLPINFDLLVLDAIALGCRVEEVGLNTPPSTTSADIGKAWIIGTSPTGRWAVDPAWENGVAVSISMDTEHIIIAQEGMEAWDKDTGGKFQFDGSVWQPIGSSGGGGTPPVVTESTTNLDADGTNSGNYTRFTNASAKTYTFDSADTFTVGAEYHGRNVGAGDLTLTEAGSFVINPPAGGSMVVPQDGTFTVKIVGAAEADLFGVTNP